MPGSLSHVEIGVADAPQSLVFFQRLFDWSPQRLGATEEAWLQTPSIRVGVHGDDPQSRMVVYFRVSDMADSVSRVRALGGQAGDISPHEPGFGRFCQCHDPQGVCFGLHQPDPLES
ncbi:hypothetical protein BLX41_14000 [Pseudomonas protegens]|uniref:VOC family protein n=1 Tax=Pseudomonas protegens TaxID=380021 RepID=UPI000F4B84FC|nr:VOC family protein [Pseudomonas protegens]ROL76476.1 hypothetical protein BLX41_14000 [Pseudomonas protegens]